MEEKNNIYADLIRLVAVSSGYAFISIYFASILLFLYPMWYLRASVKHGIVKSVAAMAISAAFISLGTSYMMGITIFFTFVPMLLAFHYCVETKKNYLFTLIAMALALFSSAIALEYGQLNAMGGIDFAKVIDDLVNVQLSGLGEGMTNLELSRVEDALRSAYTFAARIMPGILAVICLIASYLNYTTAGRTLLKEGIPINQPPLFFLMQIPKNIMAFMVAAALTVGALTLMNAQNTSIFAENLLVIFGFIFLVNGLATLSFFMIKLRVPSFIRIIVYLLSFLFLQLALTLVLLGVTDSMINLRKIGTRKE